MSNNNNKNRKGYEDVMYSDLVEDDTYYLKISDEKPMPVTFLSKRLLKEKPFKVVSVSLEYKDESFSVTGTLNDDVVEIILPSGDDAVLLKKRSHSGGKRSKSTKRSKGTKRTKRITRTRK